MTKRHAPRTVDTSLDYSDEDGFSPESIAILRTLLIDVDGPQHALRDLTALAPKTDVKLSQSDQIPVEQ